MKKKRVRRDQLKYPAFDPLYAPKNRRELIDVDYLHKLSESEKAWLNKFLDEYNGANLNFKNLRKNFHRTKKLKKDCTDRNNARNRDMFTFAKANVLLVDESKIQDYHFNAANPEITEESIITALDYHNNPNSVIRTKFVTLNIDLKVSVKIECLCGKDLISRKIRLMSALIEPFQGY